jgi:hypothetical protein
MTNFGRNQSRVNLRRMARVLYAASACASLSPCYRLTIFTAALCTNAEPN